MEMICIEENAFYALVENVIARIKEKQKYSADKWISGSEAMAILRIKSSTTLQKLRDEGKIRFSQPGRVVLYDRDSITDYLEDFTYETFEMP